MNKFQKQELTLYVKESFLNIIGIRIYMAFSGYTIKKFQNIKNQSRTKECEIISKLLQMLVLNGS